jgi:hypothetical protein
MGGDTDLYGYCLADPINLVDPDGLKWYDFLTKIAAGIAVDPLVRTCTNDPTGQRIMKAGISGAVGGFVAGTVGGATAGASATGILAGFGAVPGAVIGGISGTFAGLAMGLLSATVKEGLGIPEIAAEIKGMAKDWFSNSTDTSPRGPCPESDKGGCESR